MSKKAAGVKSPKIGSYIYVDSAFYISRGEDDRLGGRAKVAKITLSKSGTPFVTVEPFPAMSFNWEILSTEQAALKKEFGRKKARPDPDPVSEPW